MFLKERESKKGTHCRALRFLLSFLLLTFYRNIIKAIAHILNIKSSNLCYSFFIYFDYLSYF